MYPMFADQKKEKQYAENMRSELRYAPLGGLLDRRLAPFPLKEANPEIVPKNIVKKKRGSLTAQQQRYLATESLIGRGFDPATGEAFYLLGACNHRSVFGNNLFGSHLTVSFVCAANVIGEV